MRWQRNPRSHSRTPPCLELGAGAGGGEEWPAPAPQLSAASQLESIWLSSPAQAGVPPWAISAAGCWLSPRRGADASVFCLGHHGSWVAPWGEGAREHQVLWCAAYPEALWRWRPLASLEVPSGPLAFSSPCSLSGSHLSSSLISAQGSLPL